MNHQRGAAAALASMIIGTALGLAIAGRPRRALVWVAAINVAMAAIVLTPWMFVVGLALGLGSVVDTYICAARSDEPLRLWETRNAIVLAVALSTMFGLRAWVFDAYRIPSSSEYPTLMIGDHVFVDKLSLHWRAPASGELVVFAYPCDPRRDYVKRVIAVAGDTVEVRCNIVWVNGRAVPSTLVDAACTYDDFDDVGARWIPHACSRYHETLGGVDYDTFHDAERPTRDRALAQPDAQRTSFGDGRDFPLVRGAMSRVPSCADSSSVDDGPTADVAVAHPGTIVETKPGALACEPQLHYVVPADQLFVLGDNRNNSNDSRVWGGVPTSSVKGRVLGIWMTSNPSVSWWSRIGRVY